LERRKFLTLGWNIPYDFNDSDFDVCENLLCTLLDEYEVPPWDALKYLIAEANYGGRVTDEWDRRILRTYINQFFAEEAIDVQNFKLASLPAYHIPDDGDLASYKDFCAGLPTIDRPDVFGQHTNSDIASQIRESNNLLSTLMSLEPQSSATSGISREDRVTNMAGEILKQIPEDIDYEQAFKLIKNDPSPINTVLLQEIRRYNMLLDVMRASLGDLQKGIKGLIVMNSELEDLYNAISEGKVPSLWIKTYPSLKNLGAWTRDLILRVEFFSDWAKGYVD
jgi:dynein heavy chain